MHRRGILVAAAIVVWACRPAESGLTEPNTHPDALTCAPSSPPADETCSPRVVPPSNQSSRSGCKSDAECTARPQGRCVKTGHPDWPPSVGAAERPSPLFAEPPVPPPATACVYDTCTSNADCPSGTRCRCGTGDERNRCIGLDRCRSDHDCGDSSLCACGEGGEPNVCRPGNCRTDADCGSERCLAAFCTSKADACVENKGCKAPDDRWAECVYEPSKHHRVCVERPLLPPG